MIDDRISVLKQVVFSALILYFQVISMRILICDDEADYLDQLNIHINEYMRNHFIEDKVQ